MVLKKETPFGLTFGQLLSVLALFGGMIAAWVNINVRIANNELRIDQLERARDESIEVIETIRTENRADHIEMTRKLDVVLYNMSNDNR